MVGKTISISELGGQSHLVTVEVNLTNGLPTIVIVGLATKAVDESKERIRAAFSASSINLPRKRITINLAPADIPKDSSGFDVAMAVSIMKSAGIVPNTKTKEIFIGELGLDGSIRSVRGMIGKLLSGKRKKIHRFYIPKANLDQASLVPGIELVVIDSLSQLYGFLTGSIDKRIVATSKTISISQKAVNYESYNNLIDVSGQARAKRVLEIAAAGGHNVLFNGPPGTGKSMLAKALIGIIPPMTTEEILEVTQLHSLANNDYDNIVSNRPFRSPHHSASEIAIVGGGSRAYPGEISLAHHGVLFLDELPEYNRSTIESLRQPLEDGEITVSRAKQTATYPANFIMVATSNPCPCGYYGSTRDCTCPPHLLQAYQRKLSGPILDRIDLFSNVDDVNHEDLLKTKSGSESSEDVLKRTKKARSIQVNRFGKSTKTNASMTNSETKKHSALSTDAKNLLDDAAKKLDISARSYMRIIKVARTIADLDNSETIEDNHVTEAISYRHINSSW